jgi:hypothetical protein
VVFGSLYEVSRDYAQMVKLVDTRVLEARAVRRVGSSPILGTIRYPDRIPRFTNKDFLDSNSRN